MNEDGAFVTLWRSVRSHEPHVLLRLALGVVTALTLAAGGMALAWTHAQVIRHRYVSDEEIGLALAGAAVCWFAGLIFIWWPVRRGRRFTVPAIATLAIGVAAIGCMFALSEVLHIREEEYLMVAVFLLGVAAIVLVWLPALHHLMQAWPALGSDNQVRVHCPHCGYSLIGLRNLRCPECGQVFTIDELIRAQNYSGAAKRAAPHDGPPPTPDISRPDGRHDHTLRCGPADR